MFSHKDAACVPRTRKCTESRRTFTDAMYVTMLVYPIPLCMLTLYYNYGFDYGVTGLHLVWPLVPLVPFLLTGHCSRDLLDMATVLTGSSAIALAAMRRAYYAFLAFVVHSVAYYFSRCRGMQYRTMSSPSVFNAAACAAIWFMYVALLQSCVESHGSIDCERATRKMLREDYCEPTEY